MSRTVAGGCHCGAVRFSASGLKDDAPCANNNNDIDAAVAQGVLRRYTFNTRVAQHLFCATCGVQSFYIPRSNPDGISINVRCLDGVDADNLRAHGFVLEDFDGVNWEQNAAALAHLSHAPASEGAADSRK